jgi:hypothetical protein
LARSTHEELGYIEPDDLEEVVIPKKDLLYRFGMAANAGAGTPEIGISSRLAYTNAHELKYQSTLTVIRGLDTNPAAVARGNEVVSNLRLSMPPIEVKKGLISSQFVEGFDLVSYKYDIIGTKGPRMGNLLVAAEDTAKIIEKAKLTASEIANQIGQFGFPAKTLTGVLTPGGTAYDNYHLRFEVASHVKPKLWLDVKIVPHSPSLINNFKALTALEIQSGLLDKNLLFLRINEGDSVKDGDYSMARAMNALFSRLGQDGKTDFMTLCNTLREKGNHIVHVEAKTILFPLKKAWKQYRLGPIKLFKRRLPPAKEREVNAKLMATSLYELSTSEPGEEYAIFFAYAPLTSVEFNAALETATGYVSNSEIFPIPTRGRILRRIDKLYFEGLAIKVWTGHHSCPALDHIFGVKDGLREAKRPKEILPEEALKEALDGNPDITKAIEIGAKYRRCDPYNLVRGW